MLTLDRVKLIATLDSLISYTPEMFISIGDENLLFQTVEPFELSVKIKPKVYELVIEFTGKILGEGYPQLISKNTIMKCFERLKELGICEVDPVKMMTAKAAKVDITKDYYIEDVPALARYVKASIRNNQRYSCKKYNRGVKIEKVVSSSKYWVGLRIYDKEHEMKLSDNRPFVSENGLEGQFDGLCRFELSMVSMEQIRKALDITGCTLEEVLRSEKNPIRDYLDVILAEDPERKGISCWNDYVKHCILRDCDGDLEKVEAKLRQFKNPRSTNIPKTVDSFRGILAGLSDSSSTWSKSKLLDIVK